MRSFTRIRKHVCLFIVISLLLSLIGTVSAAGTASDDTAGHWAEKTLRVWAASGLLQGYEDGSYQPDRSITRAEIITLINRAFKLKDETSITFSDLTSSSWAYQQISIAVKAGYVNGYSDGTIRPNESVTREEAATMVASLLGMHTEEKEVTLLFKDAASISSWSFASVASLVDNNLISGYPDGRFVPQGNLTRAETVTILAAALDYEQPKVQYSTAGVYGPVTGTETIKGNVIISTPGVTLRNLVIEGDLRLTSGVAEGDVYLNKVTVNGTMNINGGGKDSIHINDSIILHIVVNKQGSIVRVVAEGDTSIQRITLESAAIVEESNLKSQGFVEVELIRILPSQKVTLSGSFNTFLIFAQTIQVEAANGSINFLIVNKGAKGSTIVVSSSAQIVKAVLNARASFTGQGTVQHAIVNIDGAGTTFEKKPVKIEGEGASERQ